MIIPIKQRAYIQNFLDYISGFCEVEPVTISELGLVENNLKLLLGRIQRLKDNALVSVDIVYPNANRVNMSKKPSIDPNAPSKEC